jgi:hypothetical protein
MIMSPDTDTIRYPAAKFLDLLPADAVGWFLGRRGEAPRISGRQTLRCVSLRRLRDMASGIKTKTRHIQRQQQTLLAYSVRR